MSSFELQRLKKRKAALETRIDDLMKDKSALYMSLDESATELENVRREIQLIEGSRLILTPEPVRMGID